MASFSLNHKKILVRSLIFGGVFLAIIFSFLILLNILVNPDLWKGKLETFLKTYVTAEISLGDFKFQTLKGLGLEIDNVEVVQNEKKVFSTRKLKILLSPRSVLRFRPSWRIVFEEPQAFLSLGRDDRFNFSDLIKIQKTRTEENEEKKTSLVMKFLAASVFDFHFNNGKFDFVNEKKNQSVHLENFSLDLTRMGIDQEIGIQLKGVLSPFKDFGVSLAGESEFSGNVRLLSLSPLKFHTAGSFNLDKVNITYQEELFSKPLGSKLSFYSSLTVEEFQKYLGEFHIGLEGVNILGKIEEDEVLVETNYFVAESLKKFLKPLEVLDISGGVQLKLSLKGEGFQKRNLNLITDNVYLKIPPILKGAHIEEKVKVNGHYEVDLEGVEIQKLKGTGGVDLTRAKIVYEGDPKKTYFKKEPMVPLFAQGEFQYTQESGIFFKKLEAQLDQFSFLISKEAYFKDWNHKKISLETSQLDFEKLALFFPTIQGMKIEQGILEPTVFEFDNTQLRSHIVFHNIRGDVSALPKLSQKTFIQKGFFGLTGEAHIELDGNTLTYFDGKVYSDLDKVHFQYGDYFQKSDNQSLKIESEVSLKGEKWMTQGKLKFRDFGVSLSGEMFNEFLKIHFVTKEVHVENVSQLSPFLKDYDLRQGLLDCEASITGNIRGPFVQIDGALHKVQGKIASKKELAPGLNIQGPFFVNSDFKVVTDQKSTQIKSLKVELFLNTSEIEYKNLFKKKKDEDLELKLMASQENGKTLIQEGDLKFKNIPFKIGGSITDLKKGIFNLSVASKISDMSVLHSTIPQLKEMEAQGEIVFSGTVQKKSEEEKIKFKQDITLQKASLKLKGLQPRLHNIQGSFTLEDKALTIKNLQVRAADSDLTVYGDLKDIDHPKGSFSFHSDFFNFDKVLQGDEKRKPSTQEKSDSMGIVETLKTAPFFKNLDVSGKIDFKKGILSQFQFEDFSASLSLKGLVFNLTKLSTKTYGGKIAATTMIRFTDVKPSYVFEGAVADLDLQKFIAVKNEKLSDEIQGKFFTRCIVSGEGVLWEHFVSNAQGSGELIIKDGKFSHLNIIKSVLDTLKVFGAQIPSDLDISGNYEKLQGNFVLEKGNIKTDNLRLDARDYYVTLDGIYNLDTSLDYKGRYNFKRRGFGFPIYVDITGTLNKPEVHPDVQEYLKNIITNVITDIFN
ncbi:MAG: hypothetical protein HYW47_00500 [Deltaproteobacteria bacterium]|nr:hypothetical protein [Deltaproteobacteria bacterium]